MFTHQLCQVARFGVAQERKKYALITYLDSGK